MAMYQEHELGSYDLIQEDGVAYISFLRTKDTGMFKLSEILKANGLKKTGIWTIIRQFYCYEYEVTVAEPLFTGPINKFFLRIIGSPIEKISTEKKRITFYEQNHQLPPNSVFDYAFIKVRVPVKEI